MKPEEKELLTKDVCARITYHLKVNCADKVYDVLGYTNNKLIIVLPFMSNLEGHPIETCKPYLRPITDMTENEMWNYDYKRENHTEWEAYDYLNSIHIDYRGLISMGLALPVPEGMYNLN